MSATSSPGRDNLSLVVTCELWGICCDDLGEYWPHYNCHALYMLGMVCIDTDSYSYIRREIERGRLGSIYLSIYIYIYAWEYIYFQVHAISWPIPSVAKDTQMKNNAQSVISSLNESEWRIYPSKLLVVSLVSLTASLMTTSRMQQCLNVM